MTAQGVGARNGRLALTTTLGAAGVSMTGNSVSFIAVPWFVQSTTGQPVYTGLVGAAAAAGVALGGLLSGPLLDRFGYQRMSVIFDLFAGAIIGLIPFLSLSIGLPMWALAAMIFASGACGIASATARQSLLPGLCAIASVRLARMSALYWTLQRMSLAFAALPAGLLIASVGPRNALLFDAGSLVVAATIMAAARAFRDVGMAVDRRGYLRELREGLSFMRRDHLIVLIVGVAVVLAALDAPLLTVLLPVYSQATDGAALLGQLVAAYAAGALVGTVSYGVVAHRLPIRVLVVGCLAAIGAGYSALWLAPNSTAYLIILALMGLSSGPLTPLIITTVQKRTPPQLLGRVTGAIFAAVLAAIPVGRAVGGYAVAFVGPSWMLVIAAASYLLASALLALDRRFRQLL